MTDKEIKVLTKYFENKSSVVTKEDKELLLPIYNRVLRRKQEMTDCAPCWVNIQDTLESILKYNK